MVSRTQALRSTSEQSFDLCVIGGGATGAGCALDAQLRGLRVVLIEAGDFASGTSGNCSKMVHGGVRYLQQAVVHGDFQQYRFVKTALQERKAMLDNAPHLAQPTLFLVPCFNRREMFYYGFGLKLYDRIAGASRLIPTRFFSRDETLARLPALQKHLLGAVAYGDGTFDDSRYAIALVQTFSNLGGTALNYARVTGFARNCGRKLEQAQIDDRLNGTRFVLHAKIFVNATGPSSDRLRLLANERATPRLRLSRGIHVVLPLEALGGEDALLIPQTDDGRIAYAIPWRGRYSVGTTGRETTADEPLVVQREEAEYLLHHLNGYLARPVKLDDVVSAFAGVRPLVSVGDARHTKRLVRSHEVEVDAASGLISIMGGKWTTYRAMAEDTINTVQQQLGLPVTPSRTADYRLAGAEEFDDDTIAAMTAASSVPKHTARHLVEKFGTYSGEILELTTAELELLSPLVAGVPPILAEVVYAVRKEMAVSLEDILIRRTGLQLYSWMCAIHAAPAVSRILARELGWSDERRQRELATYVDGIHRQRAALGVSVQ